MDSPIKLAHCTYELGFGGGIARMDALYHRFLDRNKVNPIFVVPNAGIFEGGVYDDSIDYIVTGLDNRFQRLVEIFSDVDIVQFSGGFDPLVCEAARIANVPAIVEIMHHTEPGQLFPYIDISICVSKVVKAVQPNQDKAVVIHNGIDLADFPPANKKGFPQKIVLIESTRREKKIWFHLDELADEIFATDSDTELWLAGRGQVGKSTEQIKFLGLREDIDELYRESDILVLLSKKEPFGLVALEAMASGCLVVASDDGGMAEIITNDVDGWLCDASDKNCVTKTIRKAIETRKTKMWDDMVCKARETVTQTFSPRSCVEKYENIYEELMEKKGRRKSKETITSDPSSDALLGEAVHFFDTSIDDSSSCVERMASEKSPISNLRLAKILELLGLQFESKGKPETADTAYRKLFHSGFSGTSWMKRWLDLDLLSDNESRHVLEKLVSQNPSDVEAIMLSVELGIKSGDLGRVMEMLATGIKNNPKSDELASIYALIKNKVD